MDLGIPASWADGHRVLIGESAVDFEITLLKINRSRHFASLMVKHVPPAQLQVRLPAPWMQKPAARKQINWVQITKMASKFVAGVGKETFDVQMKVNLVNGKILSGTMVNQVSGTDETAWMQPSQGMVTLVRLRFQGASRSHCRIKRKRATTSRNAGTRLFKTASC